MGVRVNAMVCFTAFYEYFEYSDGRGGVAFLEHLVQRKIGEGLECTPVTLSLAPLSSRSKRAHAPLAL